MAVINYLTIHGKIETEIKKANANFKYRDAANWFNIELGEFPTANLQNAFTVRIINQTESEISDDWVILEVEVEFVLDAKKDRYLNQLGSCHNGIRRIRDISGTDIQIADSEIIPEFDLTFFKDFVIATFNNINIEIRSE